MNEKVKFKSVLVKGNFYFIKNSVYNFKGPMRRGFKACCLVY